MKMIIGIIRPERLEAVEEALRAILDEGDHYRLTVDTVEGHGRQEGEVEIFRGQKVRSTRVPKTRLTICVNDAYVEKTVGRSLHVWSGECHVHAGIRPADITHVRAEHPGADFLIHPECGCVTSVT